MTNVVPFDTLALASALRDEAGLDQQQAEGFARVLSRALVGDMATKADLVEAKTELKASIRETELRLEAKIAETKTDLTKTILSAVVLNSVMVIGAMFGLAKLLGH